MANRRTQVDRGTGRAVVWLARQVELVLAEHDLTLAQYRVLTLLEEQPEGASSLADKMTVSRPSVTAVVDGLVERGLVTRTAAQQDRRRVNHSITPQGRALIGRADEVIESGLAVVLEHLDPTGASGIVTGFASLRRLTERLAVAGRAEATS